MKRLNNEREKNAALNALFSLYEIGGRKMKLDLTLGTMGIIVQVSRLTMRRHIVA